jgi:hypothetical protein
MKPIITCSDKKNVLYHAHVFFQHWATQQQTTWHTASSGTSMHMIARWKVPHLQHLLSSTLHMLSADYAGLLAMAAADGIVLRRLQY